MDNQDNIKLSKVRSKLLELSDVLYHTGAVDAARKVLSVSRYISAALELVKDDEEHDDIGQNIETELEKESPPPLEEEEVTAEGVTKAIHAAAVRLGLHFAPNPDSAYHSTQMLGNLMIDHQRGPDKKLISVLFIFNNEQKTFFAQTEDGFFKSFGPHDTKEFVQSSGKSSDLSNTATKAINDIHHSIRERLG